MPAYQSQQRITKAYIPYAGIRGEDILWIGGRRQEDKLDSKSDYYRVYIRLGVSHLLSHTKCIHKYE